MTYRTLLLAAASAALVAAPAHAGPAGEPVTVTLTGVRADAGPIYVGLQTREQFMKQAGTAGSVVPAPTDGTVTVTLADVPVGTYSIGVWQDTDRDGRFSMGADGRPTDGWSSIGAAALTAPPTFEGSSFTVAAQLAAVTLAMMYPGQ